MLYFMKKKWLMKNYRLLPFHNIIFVILNPSFFCFFILVFAQPDPEFLPMS